MTAETMKELIAVEQWVELESAWMQAIEAKAPPDEMGPVLEALLEAEKLDLAETLAWMLLEEHVEKSPPQQALDVAKVVVTAVPISDELRSQAAELYRRLHGDHEHFDALLRASGLTTGQSPRRAFRTLETSLAIRPGGYLANRFDNQVVRAVGYDEALGDFQVADAAGAQRTLEPKKLADEFDPVGETDFRVLCQHRREHLGELIEADPAAVLIGLCIASGGQIDATTLKEKLAGTYIPADKWSGWWNRARTAAKRSPHLELTGRSPIMVRYHPSGRTLEEELAAPAAKARTPLGYLAVLRDYVRQARQRKVSVRADFVGPILDALAEQVARVRRTRPGDALAASLAIAAGAKLGLPPPERAFASPEEILAAAQAPAEALAGLQDPALWPGALEALSARPDADEQLGRLMLLAPAEQLDDVAARLGRAGRANAVEAAVAAAMADPARHVELCVWLWKGPAAAPASMPGKVDVLSRVLGILEEVHHGWEVEADHRKAVSHRIRSVLSSGGFGAYKEALGQMDEGVAATMKRRIERADGLAQAVRDDMLALLREGFFSLFVERRRREPWQDEATLYVTEASLGRRQDELKALVEVKMPANARAIGVAAAHGDLSENSEWKFALEERDRLAALANTIRDELNMARTIHPDDAPAEEVGIGSRVLLKRIADGRELEACFLGPWDVDVENRVFSYKSQLGQDMMGKAVGDTVQIKIAGAEGEYRIARLGPALE